MPTLEERVDALEIEYRNLRHDLTEVAHAQVEIAQCLRDTILPKLSNISDVLAGVAATVGRIDAESEERYETTLALIKRVEDLKSSVVNNSDAVVAVQKRTSDIASRMQVKHAQNQERLTSVEKRITVVERGTEDTGRFARDALLQRASRAEIEVEATKRTHLDLFVRVAVVVLTAVLSVGCTVLLGRCSQ